MSWNVVEKFSFDPTGGSDNADELATLAEDLREYKAANRPLPRVVFPEGVYNFSTWPNLAINGLECVGEGNVLLRHTGSGPAITFDGVSTGPGGGGQFNMLIDNFYIMPNGNTTDTFILNSIHHSLVRVHALGVGVPGSKAISMYWCVLTELNNCSVTPHDDKVFGPGGSYDCIGLWLDKVTQPSHWQTTACRFVNPILENLRIGAWLEDAGGCQFTGGAIEYCTERGIVIRTGGNNQTRNLWLEGNNERDIWFKYDTHDNRFEVTNGNAHVQNDAILGGNNRVVSPSDIL
jgi:hypothetical protein